jgi:hypothetical protein
LFGITYELSPDNVLPILIKLSSCILLPHSIIVFSL